MESPAPEVFELIRYEREFLVIAKKACVHSTGPSHAGEASLSEALLASGLLLEEGLRDGGLVQRLDFSSSGLMLVARTGAVQDVFRQAVLQGKIKKRYLCLLEHVLKTPRHIQGYIGSPNRRAKKMKFYPRQPKTKERALASETHFFPLGPGPLEDTCFALAQASPARRHQVRLHAATLGFPLIGDPLYGPHTKDRRALLVTHPIFHNEKRDFFLHACELIFQDPGTNKAIQVQHISGGLHLPSL